MTDLVLIGIFILCAVIGYLVVKKSGGLLEHIFFKDSKVWYTMRESNARESNARESNEPGRDNGAGNACSQEISRDNGSVRRKSACPGRRSFFGHKKSFKAGIKHEWKTN